MAAQIIRVSQLNRYVKAQLEENELLRDLLVRGELTSVSYRSQSGHYYFTISDEGATLRCVMFARYAQHLAAFPQEGSLVIVRGAKTLKERDGQYQLTAYDIQTMGQGSGSADYNTLRQKMYLEGLLAKERKRQAPRLPRAVGVITSAEGAAVQDIITGMRRHNDLIPLVIYPSTVQGASAVEALLYALRCAIVEGCCDVLIIARGGGAAETLAVFNDERLLRAVAASPVPVISAVGHDVDQTLLDEVADIRAATPTAACQYCCASNQEVRDVCARLQGSMLLAIQDRLNGARQQYIALQRILKAKSPGMLWSQNRQRLDYLKQLLQEMAGHRLWRLSQRSALLQGQLSLLDPSLPVERGYSMTFYRRKNGRVPLRSCREINIGETILTQITDGEIESTVTAVYLQ